MCTPAYRVTAEPWMGEGDSRFVKWITSSSPTSARSTSGLGRLPGRSITRPGLRSPPGSQLTTSPLSA